MDGARLPPGSEVINRPGGSRTFLSATAVTFPGATQRTQSGVAGPARPIRPYTRSRPGDVLGLPADASEDEVAARLAAAGISQSEAMKMVKGKGTDMSGMKERK